MHNYKVAAIPGDGIGVEVIATGLEVLDVVAKRDGVFITCSLGDQKFPGAPTII